MLTSWCLRDLYHSALGAGQLTKGTACMYKLGKFNNKYTQHTALNTHSIVHVTNINTLYAKVKITHSCLMTTPIPPHLKRSLNRSCPVCPPVTRNCWCTNREVSVWSTASLSSSFPLMEYKWRQGSDYITACMYTQHTHAQYRHTQREQGEKERKGSPHFQPFNATASNA